MRQVGSGQSAANLLPTPCRTFSTNSRPHDIFSDIFISLAIILGIGAALRFLLRIKGPTAGNMTVFLRHIALCLFVGALFSAGAALFYSVLGVALGIRGAWFLLAFGFAPAALFSWLGIVLWRKTRKPPPPPVP